VTRVLVLRAREDAARTSTKLRSMDIEPVVSPVLEIVATGATIPAGDYNAILASSAKGMECAGAEVESFKSLPLHAVGVKTAKAAEERGWRPEIVAGNAEALLPTLLARYLTPAHFLYLAGRDRQAALEAGLRAAGHRITAVNVYQARAATALSDDARAMIAAGDIDIALHYSRRSVEIFLALAKAAGLMPRLQEMAHVALSEDVATPLKAMGLVVLRAQKPDEEHLLKVAAILSASSDIRDD